MKIGNYYLNVEKTHGSIDRKYKCSIVDGLFDVGSGDTKYEAMKSCIDVVIREAIKLKNDFEKIKL